MTWRGYASDISCPDQNAALYLSFVTNPGFCWRTKTLTTYTRRPQPGTTEQLRIRNQFQRLRARLKRLGETETQALAERSRLERDRVVAAQARVEACKQALQQAVDARAFAIGEARRCGALDMTRQLAEALGVTPARITQMQRQPRDRDKEALRAKLAGRQRRAQAKAATILAEADKGPPILHHRRRTTTTPAPPPNPS